VTRLQPIGVASNPPAKPLRRKSKQSGSLWTTIDAHAQQDARVAHGGSSEGAP
jgi:hypothetical protein